MPAPNPAYMGEILSKLIESYPDSTDVTYENKFNYEVREINASIAYLREKALIIQADGRQPFIRFSAITPNQLDESKPLAAIGVRAYATAAGIDLYQSGANFW